LLHFNYTITSSQGFIELFEVDASEREGIFMLYELLRFLKIINLIPLFFLFNLCVFCFKFNPSATIVLRLKEVV